MLSQVISSAAASPASRAMPMLALEPSLRKSYTGVAFRRAEREGIYHENETLRYDDAWFPVEKKA